MLQFFLLVPLSLYPCWLSLCYRNKIAEVINFKKGRLIFNEICVHDTDCAPHCSVWNIMLGVCEDPVILQGQTLNE